MKKLAICLALVGLIGFTGQASAVIGTADDVPAATLLLPYFEVDTTSATGVQTLFSINNASAAAVLAHVTVWSDQSIPVLDFDVYLTGYDVQTINLYDIFVNRTLPRTASTSQDPSDTISPQGPVSDDDPFPNCSALPYTPGNSISVGFQAHLIAWLQGNQSPSTGNCAGSKQNDGILRGYVTVDTVLDCNLFFPSDWAFYAPFVTDQNVLWGDYFYVNGTQNFAQGETMVAIESSPASFVPGDHTFYGRYNAALADDSREPLPTTTGVRFINGGVFDGGTDLIVWREANSHDTAYSCSLQGPTQWYPLEATQIVIFDEQEQPVTTDDCPSGDPTCEQEILIPNEAQRTSVATDLGALFDFGWVYLNLQHNNAGFFAIYADPYAQSWVTAVMDADGRFSVGFDAVQFDNANTPNTNIIPVGGGAEN